MSTNIKIESQIGDLEVIKNEMIHVSDEYPLKITIDDLEIVFEFRTDKENKESKTKNKIEGNKFIWELTNYNNSLGEGILIPINIATIGDRKIYISFFVWAPSNDKRIINYVISKGRKDA